MSVNQRRGEEKEKKERWHFDLWVVEIGVVVDSSDEKQRQHTGTWRRKLTVEDDAKKTKLPIFS